MTIPYPRSPETFTLAPAEYADKIAAFEETATKIGNVIYAWNELHHAFLGLFAAILGPGQYYHAIGIWNALKADSAQRDILAGAAALGLKAHPLAEDIAWTVKEAGAVAMHRNDAAHSPFTFLGLLLSPIPDDRFGHPLAARLSKRDLHKSLKEAAEYFLTLSAYVDLLAEHVLRPAGKLPLPSKPLRPPTLREGNQKQINRKQPRKARQTPRPT